MGHFCNVPGKCPTGINGIIRVGSGVAGDPLRWDMGHKIKSCSYKNTAARNARALQKSQEGPIFVRRRWKAASIVHGRNYFPIVFNVVRFPLAFIVNHGDFQS